MNIATLVAELDRIHDADHASSYDPCDCYERLAKAVRGEGLFFPEVPQGCDEPPEYGCETPEAAMMRTIMERINASRVRDEGLLMLRVTELLNLRNMPDTIRERAAERTINPPVSIGDAGTADRVPGGEPNRYLSLTVKTGVPENQTIRIGPPDDDGRGANK